MPTPKISMHRANTLEKIHQALDNPSVTSMEFDVQMTKDGTLVLYHDKYFTEQLEVNFSIDRRDLRLTDEQFVTKYKNPSPLEDTHQDNKPSSRRRLISDMTHAEIQEANQGVITFEELLDAVNKKGRTDFELIVELKNEHPELAPAVMKMVAEKSLIEHTILASFIPDHLIAAEQQEEKASEGTSFRKALIVGLSSKHDAEVDFDKAFDVATVDELIGKDFGFKPDFLSLSKDMLVHGSEEQLRQLSTEQGAKLIAWTVNNLDGMYQEPLSCLESVITDVPRAIEQQIQMREAQAKRTSQAQQVA